MFVKIYVASKTCHAKMWKDYRYKGLPIISSWIDEAGEGESSNLSDLWVRIDNEIAHATDMLLYANSQDFPLKGALVEAGMAIAHKIPIHVVLDKVEVETRSKRPIGSWVLHPNITVYKSLEHAIEAIMKPQQNLLM